MALFDFINRQDKPQGNQNQNQNQQGNNSQGNNNNQGGLSDQGTGKTGILGDGKPNENGNPANPLDAFTKLFDNTNKDSKVAPSFTLPDDKLNDVAASLDFTQDIDQAIMQKALSGDSNSLIAMMKHISQEAYKTAMKHNSTLTGAFVDSRSQYDGSSLSSRIKEELTNAEFSNNTPGFNHPLVKQELQKVSALIAKNHPDASPAEVAKQAKEYLQLIASNINPAKPNKDEDGNPVGDPTDWMQVILGKSSGMQ